VSQKVEMVVGRWQDYEGDELAGGGGYGSMMCYVFGYSFSMSDPDSKSCTSKVLRGI
jgi:hypothetical protein